MFFFVDLETTGLDEDQNDILELGVAITDIDLDILSMRSWLVEPRDEYKSHLHPVVLEMHSKNGLFQEIDEHKGRDRHQVCVQALEFCSKHAVSLKEHPLCGASVHFDRRFLRRWMPALDGAFSHRIIDTSTIKALARSWAPQILEFTPEIPNSESEHRVIPDMENTIATLRYYKEVFFKPFKETVQVAI